jgi:hypothetical protein
MLLCERIKGPKIWPKIGPLFLKTWTRPAGRVQTGQKMFNSSRQSPPNPRYTRSPPNNSALLEQIKNLVYRRYAGDTSRVFMAFNLNR